MASQLLTVAVRFNSSIPHHVKVQADWNVHRFKEEIAKIHNIAASDIQVIFQGRPMDNDAIMQVKQVNNCIKIYDKLISC